MKGPEQHPHAPRAQRDVLVDVAFLIAITVTGVAPAASIAIVGCRLMLCLFPSSRRLVDRQDVPSGHLSGGMAMRRGDRFPRA